MRKIYLLINLILLAGAVGLLAAHQNFKPTPADKILKWKPAEVSIQEASHKPQMKAPQLSAIRNKNIFSPARGEDRSAASAEENKKTPPPRFELIGICTIGDGAGAIIDLKNGRIDGVFGDTAVVNEWLKTNPQLGAATPKVTDPQYFGTGLGIAVRPDNKALLEKLNAALKAIKADGTYQKISNQWFPE